jgi:serine/threonine protein kinase HipA of HipAB toxin-antitoxin module
MDYRSTIATHEAHGMNKRIKRGVLAVSVIAALASAMALADRGPTEAPRDQADVPQADMAAAMLSFPNVAAGGWEQLFMPR